MVDERTLAIEAIFHDEGVGTALAPAALSARKAQQGGKADGAFLTISEVADSLAVPQHVLRFWETKFSQIRPLKRGGGRRYYRPEDVALLRRIHTLLYTEGYTIRGVQKLLKSQGRSGGQGPVLASDSLPESRRSFEETPPSSADEVLAALIDHEVPSADSAPGAAPQTVSGLSPRQRRLLEGLLEDLRDLRLLVASAQGGSARAA